MYQSPLVGLTQHPLGLVQRNGATQALSYGCVCSIVDQETDLDGVVTALVAGAALAVD